MTDRQNIDDFTRRLSNLLHDAETLNIEMRAERSQATPGPDKARLRKAVGATEAATKQLLSAIQALSASGLWTARPIGKDEWEYHDGDRVRAILQKRSWGWLVHRVNSKGKLGGCDNFKDRESAVSFITDGRVFRPAN